MARDKLFGRSVSGRKSSIKKKYVPIIASEQVKPPNVDPNQEISLRTSANVPLNQSCATEVTEQTVGSPLKPTQPAADKLDSQTITITTFQKPSAKKQQLKPTIISSKPPQTQSVILDNIVENQSKIAQYIMNGQNNTVLSNNPPMKPAATSFQQKFYKESPEILQTQNTTQKTGHKNVQHMQMMKRSSLANEPKSKPIETS